MEKKEMTEQEKAEVAQAFLQEYRELCDKYQLRIVAGLQLMPYPTEDEVDKALPTEEPKE
jgi:hypothetical protein